MSCQIMKYAKMRKKSEQFSLLIFWTIILQWNLSYSNVQIMAFSVYHRILWIIILIAWLIVRAASAKLVWVYVIRHNAHLNVQSALALTKMSVLNAKKLKVYTRISVLMSVRLAIKVKNSIFSIANYVCRWQTTHLSKILDNSL